MAKLVVAIYGLPVQRHKCDYSVFLKFYFIAVYEVGIVRIIYWYASLYIYSFSGILTSYRKIST